MRLHLPVNSAAQHTVDERGEYVHDQYRIGRAFRIAAERANQRDEQSSARRKDHLACVCHGAGDIIRRHEHRAEEHAAHEHALNRVAAQAAAFLLTLLIFAFNFRYLPDIRIAWRYVLGGAAATALLFAIGRQVIGLYLGYFTVGSAYGAAGSLIVVLLWVYYSAQIFFFGAELTQVLVRRHAAAVGQPRTA